MNLSSPVVADIDGDDSLEIVSCSLNQYDHHGDILFFNNQAQKEHQYATGANIEASPALSDLNNDGKLEIIVGSTNNNLYCVNQIAVKWFTLLGMIPISLICWDLFINNLVVNQ